MSRFASSETLVFQSRPQSKHLSFHGNKEAVCSSDFSRHGCPEHATTFEHSLFYFNFSQCLWAVWRISGHRSANHV